MTIEELSKEIKADYKEVRARWIQYTPKYQRQLLKNNRYPYMWETQVKTKRQNIWFINHYAESKKDASISKPQLFCPFQYTNGTWIAHIIDGHDVLLLFPAHFITRYKERLLELNLKANPYSSKDVISVFFLRNKIGIIRSEAENMLRGYCEDGMCLGEWESNSVALIKTFISRKEMKMNQFVEYYEAMTYRLVSDMFLARKGHSLISVEEIDNLPDSYFDTKEWESFLFARGNRLWIDLITECETIKRNNLKEYEKISAMLEIISDNRIPPKSQ